MHTDGNNSAYPELWRHCESNAMAGAQKTYVFVARSTHVLRLIFERNLMLVPSVAAKLNPGMQGYVMLYRPNESNRCPGCGHCHWIIGRVTAECGFCATALPLAGHGVLCTDLAEIACQ
jgi:hypothetical protein